MSSFPNLPPAPAGEAVPEKPKAGPSGLHTIADGPAPAAPPPSSQEPPQLPFIHSKADEPQGAFVSDDQFMHDLMKESHTLPTAVLIISTVLTFAIYGYKALMLADPGMAVAAVFSTTVFFALLMGVSCLTSTAAGWIICKIFGEDYGSAGSLILRFSAVATAQFPIFALAYAMVGGLLSFMFVLPVVLALAVIVAGLDLARAFLYCVFLSVINSLLLIFVFTSFATAAMS